MRALTDPATRFSSVYRAIYPDVLRYAKRRSPHPEDVTAETFATAWRRVDDLPVDLDSALAWLFGIARNTILNARRSSRRRTALAIRLDTHRQPVLGNEDDLAVTRIDLVRAWDHLSEDDQETISLTVLDGLDAARAAQVLGISAAAYRTRLSRARSRLRSHLHVEGPELRSTAVTTLPPVCLQESR
ncbi:RNA polymerase sigma factor [Acidipropionibacterium timonense]|uniref:RNA polymerase sigma factor n=1 Tax=Acidipropionibacterium timonense TaxID=2161818 RepID=UPI001AEC3783|nr:sigma-70 family RNA polymerase sigma factor [Acidipropionibacterium timonense]